MERKLTDTIADAAHNVGEAAQSRFADDLSLIKESLGKIRSELTSAAQSAFDAGKASTSAAGAQVRHAYDAVKAKGGDVKHVGEDALGELTAKIRENPGTSALIAFGVGYVVAKLISRR